MNNRKLKRSFKKLNQRRSLKGGKPPKSKKNRSSKNNKRSRRVVRRNKKGSKGGAASSPGGSTLGSIQASSSGDEILPRQDLARTPGAGVGRGVWDSPRADSRPVSVETEESLGRRLEGVKLGVRPDRRDVGRRKTETELFLMSKTTLLLARLINFIKNPENSILSGGEKDLKHSNAFINSELNSTQISQDDHIYRRGELKDIFNNKPHSEWNEKVWQIFHIQYPYLQINFISDELRQIKDDRLTELLLNLPELALWTLKLKFEGFKLDAEGNMGTIYTYFEGARGGSKLKTLIGKMFESDAKEKIKTKFYKIVEKYNKALGSLLGKTRSNNKFHQALKLIACQQDSTKVGEFKGCQKIENNFEKLGKGWEQLFSPSGKFMAQFKSNENPADKFTFFKNLDEEILVKSELFKGQSVLVVIKFIIDELYNDLQEFKPIVNNIVCNIAIPKEIGLSVELEPSQIWHTILNTDEKLEKAVRDSNLKGSTIKLKQILQLLSAVFLQINGTQNGLTDDILYDQFVGATLVMNDSLLDAGNARLPNGDVDKTTIWWKNIPSSKLVKLTFGWMYNMYNNPKVGWLLSYEQYQQKKAQGIRTEQFAEEVRADLGTPHISTQPRRTFDFSPVN